MNVGFNASGIQKGRLQIQGLLQMEFLWLLLAGVDQLLDLGMDVCFWPPSGIALEGALGGDSHRSQFIEAAKELEERAVGQADGKAAKIFFEQEPGATGEMELAQKR